MLVKKQIFSAVPGLSDPQGLLCSHQNQLLNGLRVYLGKFGETVHMDLSPLIDKVNLIDHTRRFSPSLYGIYSRMKAHYENKNLEGLFHISQTFINMTEESIYADEVTFSTFLSEDWEEAIIPDLKGSVPGNVTEKTLFPLIHWNEKDFPPADLQTALEYLQDLDEDLFQEYTVYVSRFKFFASKLLIACTSSKFFGAIYIRPPQQSEDDAILYYLDGLAHEISHLHLYAMMSEDPMVLNDPKDLFSSPLRPDLRPMYGIFHSAFVLARIVRTLRRYKQQGGNVDEILCHKEIRFQEACKVVTEQAQLTPIGLKLFKTLEHCAFQN